jgi:peptide chain release factor 2
MAAREYQLEINAIDATLVSIEKVLDLPKLRKQADELEVKAGVPNLWDDPEAAQKITSRLSRVQSEIVKLSGLRQRVEDLPILFELAAGEPGGIADAEKELDAVKKSDRKSVV